MNKREELMDRVIRAKGFENPRVIEFCKIAEDMTVSIDKVIKMAFKIIYFEQIIF